MDQIPFANPSAGFKARKQACLEAFERVLDSGWYILGPEVEAFEAAFAQWLSPEASGQCVGVANGTDAIELILRGLLRLYPVPSGKRAAVFTVSHTAVATVAAIERAGCEPVLVDVDDASFTMCPDSLGAAIRMVQEQRPDLALLAVVPVHLYGHPAQMEKILSLAETYGLKVVEDCAQAHGAQYKGRKVGTMGLAASFSFYPTKNLGAMGDAGGVFTCNAALAEEMRALRQYGWKDRYISAVPGVNTRMDPLQAAILRVNLPYLDADNALRRSVADRYAALGSAVRIPCAADQVEHVYHLYVIRHDNRQALAQALARRGVGTALHYPQAVHQQPAYAGRTLCAPGGLPVTERIVREILSLPMFPQLGDASVAHVIASVFAAVEEIQA
jgi:Predicted pyridoxal phosphate-dependent enzyme apparently involved in regulation of cell wall biogenesis